MRKRHDKNSILVFCILAIALLSFLTYGYSLIKKDNLRRNGKKEPSDEVVITSPEEDPEYNSFCKSTITFTETSSPILVGNKYSQDILINIKNESEIDFNTWKIKIPSRRVTLDKTDNASFYSQYGYYYLNGLNTIKQGETLSINATIETKDANLDLYFKTLVITSCNNTDEQVIESGKAKIVLNDLEIPLTPEISVYDTNGKDVIYSIYINNTTSYDVHNYRLVIYHEQGTYLYLNNLETTYDTENNIVSAIDTEDNKIFKGEKSKEYRLMLSNVPSDYIPNIVVVGQKS